MSVRHILFHSVKWLAVLSLVAGQAWAAEPKIVFKLAEVHPQGYPTELGDEEFARLVGERTGGRIKIEIYPGGQLGDEKAAIEQVQIGAIAFTRVSSAPMAQFSKQLGVFSLPYIFDSKEHMWAFLNGPGGTKMLEALSSSGFIGLAYYDGGARSFYASKPITKVEDLKGLKFRVMQNEWAVKMVNAFGANATPMAYGQVFSAIQTGVIEGAENNAPSYLTASHYQVAKNYLLDGHQRIPEVLVMSKIAFDTLSKEDQAILRKAAADSVSKQRQMWDAFEGEALAKVKAAGSIITDVKDPTPYQKAVKPVIDEAMPQFGEALNAIAAARPKK
jgi:tripartite ATP-independent transporter DctP family solute receptor